MLPGPTIIRQCAVCAKPFHQETLLSGNTLGARFWTDGRMEASMLPDQHALVQCPHCQALLWIDEQEILGEVDWGDRTSFKDARAYTIPTFEDYLTMLESEDLEPEKERYLRQWAWWTGNNPRRKSAAPQPLSEREAKNLWGLAALLDESDDRDRLRKAEVMRELGEFGEALKLLSEPLAPTLIEYCSKIKRLSKKGDALVREVRIAQ